MEFDRKNNVSRLENSAAKMLYRDFSDDPDQKKNFRRPFEQTNPCQRIDGSADTVQNP